jgi:hypothetical protein
VQPSDDKAKQLRGGAALRSRARSKSLSQKPLAPCGRGVGVRGPWRVIGRFYPSPQPLSRKGRGEQTTAFFVRGSHTGSRAITAHVLQSPGSLATISRRGNVAVLDLAPVRLFLLRGR